MPRMPRMIWVVYDGLRDDYLDDAIMEAMDTVVGANCFSFGSNCKKDKSYLLFSLRESEDAKEQTQIKRHDMVRYGYCGL